MNGLRLPEKIESLDKGNSIDKGHFPDRAPPQKEDSHPFSLTFQPS